MAIALDYLVDKGIPNQMHQHTLIEKWGRECLLLIGFYLLVYAQLHPKLMVFPMAPHHLECVVLREVVSMMWW